MPSSISQVPFECNGRSYRVLAANDGTYFQEIRQNDYDKTIAFTNLHFYPDIEINAIAYHPSQNVIYGVLQTPPYRLCRIDATFNLEILQELPLSSELVFVSGDISPDEKHLVLFGFGDTNFENIIALVDVESGGYETEILTLETSNPTQPYIFCADIAFHPTTGRLFGFDFKNGRLVTLDIDNRLIENDNYPLSKIVLGNIPSIFFNAEGELYGIGTNLQEETENRGYFQFDLATGQPEILQELDIEKNQDACSCPYRVKLLNEVKQRKNAPCTELIFEITIINRTSTDQFDLVLTDSFPQNINIKSISALPFDGVIERGIGGNVMTIKDIVLPIGKYSFEVVLDIDENTLLGDYENQAILSGVSLEEFKFESVYSDDPQTAIPKDATMFSIDSLSTSLDDDFFGICRGGSTILHAGFFGADSYEWSTGETTESIKVTAAGDYRVTLTTDCDQIVGTATVTLDEIRLDLGPDRIIEQGATLSIDPDYFSHSYIKKFAWQTSSDQLLDCPSCKSMVIQPQFDMDLHLTMENITGCTTSDQVFVKVIDLDIFSPNVFSPNNDGWNDSFFLQGNIPFDIAEMEIYDRWGSLVYRNNNLISNTEENGWNGTYNGQLAPPGVYVWSAVISYKSGRQERLSGDVTLMR